MATKKALTTKLTAAKKTLKADKVTLAAATKKLNTRKVSFNTAIAVVRVAKAAARVAQTKSITVIAPPAEKTVKRDDFLRADPAVSAANLLTTLRTLSKETAGEFDIAAIADDDKGYGARLRVLKALRGGQMVVVKEAEPARLKRELYELTGVKTAGAFALRCTALLAEADKAAKTAAKSIATKKKTDVIARDAELKRTAWQREVHDGVPVLDAPKKLSKKEEAADSAQFKAALAARVRRTEDELRDVPVATLRPDASVSVNLDDVTLLEDPSNGVVLMRLEKPNSQGAICVYNNGSRVAAGVVGTETLKRLRVLSTTDLVRDVNQLLHPITAGVVVTPVAERHLTVVLAHCKENIEMANKKAAETAAKTKKFEAPKGAATKAVAAKKTATKKGAESAAPTERKSSLFRLLNDTKATWNVFTTQKAAIVGAFVKLGAVGKTAAGVTRGALVAALPEVPDKNISFYLSKWQPAGIVEKLPAAE